MVRVESWWISQVLEIPDAVERIYLRAYTGKADRDSRAHGAAHYLDAPVTEEQVLAWVDEVSASLPARTSLRLWVAAFPVTTPAAKKPYTKRAEVYRSDVSPIPVEPDDEAPAEAGTPITTEALALAMAREQMRNAANMNAALIALSTGWQELSYRLIAELGENADQLRTLAARRAADPLPDPVLPVGPSPRESIVRDLFGMFAPLLAKAQAESAAPVSAAAPAPAAAPVGYDPASVRSTWERLTPEERAAWLEQLSSLSGN